MEKLPLDRNGNTIEQMEYGYYAIKGKDEIKVYSEPYKMGIFIYFYKNGKIYNQVSKDSVKRAHKLMDSTKRAFIQDSHEIIPMQGTYKVKRDKAGYFISPHNYKSPRWAKLKK